MAAAVPNPGPDHEISRPGLGAAASQVPHYLYGLRIQSEFPLPYPRLPAPVLADVAVRKGSVGDFSDVFATVRRRANQDEWNCGVPLADGRTYLRWVDRFEFLVAADGRTVTARPLKQSRREAFHTYLLGQALSFALVKQGFEPLHATVVIIDGAAVAFLGDSGYGKSSLGASFVRAGHRMLTDDMLVLSRRGARFLAHPGPPRIKLFPEMARRVLGARAGGTPLARMTLKLVIPLDEPQTLATAMPLRALYVLAPPLLPGGERRGVQISRLTKRRACVELVRNTFNTSVIDASRLGRQFRLATQLAASVPLSRLVYPRRVEALPSVQAAILADLSA